MTNYSAGPSRRAAFTLIELLTVITIILILAGLILGIAGNAQGKAARSRAQGEIQAMSTGCNNFQTDNGTYPRISTGANNTDTLDAQKSYDPTDAAYLGASLDLYRMISGAYYYDPSSSTYKVWSTSTGVAKPTVYFPFKDTQLQNTGNVMSGYVDPMTVTAIVDPFGFSYGYSTAYQAEIDAGHNPPAKGYNPTYDLWSTAGYSTSSGKPYPSPSAGSTAATYNNTLWIKNW